MAVRPNEPESRLRRFLSKDFTPYLVFSVPLIFMVIFLFWPLVTTLSGLSCPR